MVTGKKKLCSEMKQIYNKEKKKYHAWYHHCHGDKEKSYSHCQAHLQMFPKEYLLVQPSYLQEGRA